ncbi:hypothetical protein CMUS01_06253 [Colletotrichum musicola]|uniref:Zn(2)-C6 fungal-type domain-containing protein n=1 Tax=Colletotrichum musicola TaxID=2175873 RepID=A0A8H6KN67_9PEZI|nr:hypothetical protein CMUS01_06253 [Colletotrichum musicola]
MSNSFFERANPPPRRKTCVACTKAKRRCDHGQPVCLRCSRRKIECVYPNAPASRSRGAAARHTPQSTATPIPLEEDPVETLAPAPALEESDSTSLIAWSSQGPDLLPLELGELDDITLDLGFDELLDAEALFEGTLSLPVLSPKPDQMLVPARDGPPMSLAEDMIQSRLQYALDLIKTTPSTMVMENQTPWSHPLLYRAHMPREMQDAQACCALYMAKNQYNAPIILRTIQARAHELLASPLPKTRLDILARLQAILLYQIIRLFDGDISLRASAQHTLASLEPAALALVPFVKWESSQPETGPSEDFSNSCPTKEAWQEWIVQESMRRTIFFTCFFLVAHQVLVGQVSATGCEERYVFCRSWTMSAHLWNAADVVGFAVAWRERHHFVVDKEAFAEVLRVAGPDDIDAFGRMLMVGALGIEDTRLWFYNRGGSF